MQSKPKINKHMQHHISIKLLLARSRLSREKASQDVFVLINSLKIKASSCNRKMLTFLKFFF